VTKLTGRGMVTFKPQRSGQKSWGRVKLCGELPKVCACTQTPTPGGILYAPIMVGLSVILRSKPKTRRLQTVRLQSTKLPYLPCHHPTRSSHLINRWMGGRSRVRQGLLYLHVAEAVDGCMRNASLMT
jgi:hypothetical protein